MRTLLGLTLCLGALLAFAGCGSGGEAIETSATVTATAEGPAQGGGQGDGGRSGGRAPDAAKLSAELDALGERIGAQVGATIGPPGAPPLVLGSLRTGSAWSTIKVPIALQVIDEAGGVDGLSSEQSANITAAITQSDNDAAAALFDDLVASHGSVEAASQAITDLLREAGDEKTVVATEGRDGFSSYGQTEWSLEPQQTFMGALLNGCIGERSGRKFILAQMSQVSSDTWGLGSAGVPALWKGGWGPGTDGKYLVRQIGRITVGGSDYAVTLAAISGDGSFESGQSAATEVARWLVDHAADSDRDGAEPGGC